MLNDDPLEENFFASIDLHLSSTLGQCHLQVDEGQFQLRHLLIDELMLVEQVSSELSTNMQYLSLLSGPCYDCRRSHNKMGIEDASDSIQL